jgi:septal ring factor EnvC (AmiA/AmiB activator)
MALLLAAAGPQPRPRPAIPASRPAPPAGRPAPVEDGVPDLKNAIPLKDAGKLPPAAEEYRALKEKLAGEAPAVEAARQTSEALAREAFALRQKLVATAAKVQAREAAKHRHDPAIAATVLARVAYKLRLHASIAALAAENAALGKNFDRDRTTVTRMIAVLERLEHGMPPALVMRPNDALAASRSAMLVGATLPEIYRATRAAAIRLERIRKVRGDLEKERRQAVTNAAALSAARSDLSRLLAAKQAEAEAAAGQYGTLKKKLDDVADRAKSLEILTAKINALQSAPATKGVVTVGSATGGLAKGALRSPAAGPVVRGGVDGVGGAAAPGLTYATLSGAQVVAPADGRVLFAGPYHKSGQVLILQIWDGYDAVLVGLDRLSVRTGDRVLAGEPVGRMPSAGERQKRLYFELRHNGQVINPAPYIAAGSEKAEKT